MAFETIDPRIVLEGLLEFGLRGAAWRWVCSFILGRILEGGAGRQLLLSLPLGATLASAF